MEETQSQWELPDHKSVLNLHKLGEPIPIPHTNPNTGTARLHIAITPDSDKIFECSNFSRLSNSAPRSASHDLCGRGMSNNNSRHGARDKPHDSSGPSSLDSADFLTTAFLTDSLNE
jgi:hypothetical protein